MRTVSIGFSRPINHPFPVFSWLIRAYQGTKYSHVYLRFYSRSLDRVLIYESVSGGVRFLGLEAWSKQAEEVASVDLDISDDNYTKLLQYCVDNAGAKYGFWQNLGVVFSDLLKLKSNPFKSGKNCSEAIAEILQLEGFEIPKEPNLITPKDIYTLLGV